MDRYAVQVDLWGIGCALARNLGYVKGLLLRFLGDENNRCMSKNAPILIG